MTKQICIVLDTTSSMGPSLDACKKAIECLSIMLSLLGIQLTIILYGDYNQRLTSPDHVVTILTGSISSIILKLRCYKLGQNGDETVQRDMKLWPFSLKDGPDHRPQIEVDYKNNKEKFFAEEISGSI